MSDRRIDDAIDQAVRDLMNVDTDAAFRARVVERLRKPRSHRSLWRQVSVAGAAAALVLIGVVLMRDPERLVEQRANPAATTTARQPEVEPRTQERPATIVTGRMQTAGPPPVDPTHEISRGALVATVAEGPLADLPAADRDEGVAPLAAIRPLEVAALAPIPVITTTPIVVEPLPPLSDLSVAPLDPHSERE